MTGDLLDIFFTKHRCLDEAQNIAVAVSGGPDSMALAHMLAMSASGHHKTLHGLTVDHGLRANAREEATMVAEWMQDIKARHQILVWEGDKPKTALMEAARTARYQLMADYCHNHKINTLFVAHHQNDQAETFLIRLAKGSGLDGLASINPLRKYDENLTIARPLLDVSKQELVDYCDTNKIPYVQDPSNENQNYMRPRLRGSMDVLAKEGLSVKRLATTVKRLARARGALEALSEKAYAEAIKEQTAQHIIFDFENLKNNPEEIGLRVFQIALEKMRPDADYNVRMERLEELFEDLWNQSENFKPRTLGGCIFALKDKNKALWIERERHELSGSVLALA